MRGSLSIPNSLASAATCCWPSVDAELSEGGVARDRERVVESVGLAVATPLVVEVLHRGALRFRASVSTSGAGMRSDGFMPALSAAADTMTLKIEPGG